MSQSLYLQEKLLAHSMGKVTWTKPTTTYLALFTGYTTPTGGSELTGYTRQAITWNTVDIGGGTAAITTSADISFTSMPGCTLVDWAVMDASTGGNMLYYFDFDFPILVVAGNTVTFGAGNLAVTYY